MITYLNFTSLGVLAGWCALGLGDTAHAVATTASPELQPQLTTTCAECTVLVPLGTTYCSIRCRSADDSHDRHDLNQEGDVDA